MENSLLYIYFGVQAIRSTTTREKKKLCKLTKKAKMKLTTKERSARSLACFACSFVGCCCLFTSTFLSFTTSDQQAGKQQATTTTNHHKQQYNLSIEVPKRNPNWLDFYFSSNSNK